MNFVAGLVGLYDDDGSLVLVRGLCSPALPHLAVGRADILVVPDIEAGNILAKSLVYFGGHRLVGLLVGAKSPVVLTSRADSMESKMLSIAGAVLMVNMHRTLKFKIGKVHY